MIDQSALLNDVPFSEPLIFPPVTVYVSSPAFAMDGLAKAARHRTNAIKGFLLVMAGSP